VATPAAQTAHDTRHTMAQHATDKLVGTVKETVGHLFGIEALEKAGTEQLKRAKADKQRATRKREGKGTSGNIDEEDTYLQVRRQAILSEIERLGGYEKQEHNMNHVKTFERTLPLEKGMKIKKYDVKPHLREIREKGGKREQLKHVQTREKGLMKSIPVTDKDFKLKRTPFKQLCDEIRRGVQLKHVPKDQIRDRSHPRLDLLRKMQVVKKHDVLMKEIKTPLLKLKHVQTEDKSRPDLLFDKDVHVHKLDMPSLLGEVKKYHHLKHVQMADKSKPMIERDLPLKTWDKKGFLQEVEEGTDLKHI